MPQENKLSSNYHWYLPAAGNLKQLIDKLDYLKGLGHQHIWLSPPYPHGGADRGYDVIDYKNIAQEWGTMEDLENLIAQAKKRNIGIKMDLIPNHCSKQHIFFQDVIKHGEKSDYFDHFYVRKGKNGRPPNNFKSVTGGSAWHKLTNDNPDADDLWYLASFTPGQTDWNLHNPKVQEMLLGHVKFWLLKGVSGFRIDVLNAIGKTLDRDGNLPDNPTKSCCEEPEGIFYTPLGQHPRYNRNNRTIIESFCENFKAVLDKHNATLGPGESKVDAVVETLDEKFNNLDAHLLCVGNSSPDQEQQSPEPSDGKNPDLLDASFAFPFSHSIGDWDPQKSYHLLQEIYRAYGEKGAIPAWVSGTHDDRHAKDNVGNPSLLRTDSASVTDKKMRVFAAFNQLLWGQFYNYNGDEFGQGNQTPSPFQMDEISRELKLFGWIPWHAWQIATCVKCCDYMPCPIINRDEARGTIEWEQARRQKKDPNSLLNLHEKLAAIRKKIMPGNLNDMRFIKYDSNNKVICWQYDVKDPDDSGENTKIYLVMINMNDKAVDYVPPGMNAMWKETAELQLSPSSGASIGIFNGDHKISLPAISARVIELYEIAITSNPEYESPTAKTQSNHLQAKTSANSARRGGLWKRSTPVLAMQQDSKIEHQPYAVN